MLEKVMEVIKDSAVVIPSILLKNYIKLGLADRELIILIYLINVKDTSYNPNKMSEELGIKVKDILGTISRLQEKAFLEIVVTKGPKMAEHINLDNLYKKIGFLIVKKDDKPSDLYSTFEEEFGRTLSPIEYEIISNFEKDYSTELILLALKEAIFNNVNSLRYVDRILENWKKKNIKTSLDVEKERLKFKGKQEEVKELFDYDWINEEKDN